MSQQLHFALGTAFTSARDPRHYIPINTISSHPIARRIAQLPFWDRVWSCTLVSTRAKAPPVVPDIGSVLNTTWVLDTSSFHTYATYRITKRLRELSARHHRPGMCSITIEMQVEKSYPTNAGVHQGYAWIGHNVNRMHLHSLHRLFLILTDAIFRIRFQRIDWLVETGSGRFHQLLITFVCFSE